MATWKIIGALAGAVVLANCASAGETNEADEPDPRIGEEVRSICFARNINGWRTLKGVDNVVLLEANVNDWHYVELSGACPSRVLRFAEFIGIDSRPAGGCVTKGDIIIVRDTADFTRRCFIKKIYKWDEDAGAVTGEPEDGGDQPEESEADA